MLSLAIIVYNLFLIKTPLLLFLNYGIGLIFGFMISSKTIVLNKNKKMEKKLIFTSFSGLLFIFLFIGNLLIYKIIRDIELSGFIILLINTYIFLYVYFKFYNFSVENRKLFIATIIIGVLTFFVELEQEQYFNLSSAFWGMCLWQLGVSIFINGLLIKKYNYKYK
jgi:hypothetical protein